MSILRILLPLLALLIGSGAAKAQDQEGAVHTLTTRCVPTDAVSGYPKSEQHTAGESVRLSVSGKTGFKFVRWEDENGTELSTSSSFTYEMPDRDVSLTARFVFEPSSPDEPATPKEMGTVYLQVNPKEAGTINRTSGEKYEVGQTVSLTTTVKSGYRFINWTKDGVELSTNSSFSYTVESGEQTLTANYVFNPDSPAEPDAPKLAHLLTLITNPTGATSSLYGGGRYDTETSVHVYGTAKNYYTFINWTDEEGTTVSETFDFRYTMPDRDVTLTANFSYEFNPESPSEPNSSDIPDRLYVAKPRISLYDEEHVQILCETFGAEIHYTLDGTKPSKSSPAYEDDKLIELPGNLTVQAIAFKEGLIDSAIDTLEVTHFVLDVPTPEYINRHLHLTCQTPGARIRYTLDSGAAISEWSLYENPIPLTGDCTVRFMAQKDKYTDSEEGSFEFVYADYMTKGVSSAYARHFLTLSCADPAARIHYCFDDESLNEECAVYESPLPMTKSCVVKFMGVGTGLYPSEPGSYEFKLADWQETAPSLSANYETRKITVSQPSNLPVRVILDGTEETQQTPYTVDVAPGMSQLSVATIATTDDRYDSKAVDSPIVFHMAPVHSYDGHAVAWSFGEGEPMADEARLWAYFNGIPVLEATAPQTTEMTDFGRMAACVKSDGAFRSDTTYLDIDYFNTGKVAGIRNGHRLTETMLTWGDRREDYTYLRLRGTLAAEDLRFVAGFPDLATLHLADVTMDGDGYDGALAESRIETIYSDSYPEGLLSGMPRLTAAMWGRTDQAVPDRLAVESGNPNLLLWVPEGSTLPENMANYVTYSLEEGGDPTDPDGSGTTGEASRLSLTTGHPFGVFMPIHAGRVEVAKEFTQETELKVCRGWETIVLPFTPDSVVHEREGRIIPFAAVDDADIRTVRPFWLYSPTSEGWKAEKEIEALKPYIIQMPNNPDYVEAYNLNGTVTFVADNVDFYPSAMTPEALQWTGGRQFEGTFMPVEEEGLMSLNVNGEDGELPGSHFTAGATTLPFGAYVRGASGRQAIPVFGDPDGVDIPTLGDSCLVIENPAPGMLRISSSLERKVAVVTATGVTVRSLRLQPGETVTIEGLTRDLYLVAGRKVIVR